MTIKDQRTLAYWSMCAYSSHKKKEMPVKDFFKVNEIARNDKSMLKTMQKLKEQTQPFYGKAAKE